jgi:hypothetical protein
MDLSVVSIVEPGRARNDAAVRDAVAVVCAASSGVHAALVPAPLREGAPVGAALALSRCSSRTTGIPLVIPDLEPVDIVGTPTSLAEVAAAVAVLGLTRIRKELR